MASYKPHLENIDADDPANPAPFADEIQLPDGVTATDELRDNGSIRAMEIDSYCFVIDGLKRAAEGARAVYVHLNYEKFNRLADYLDAFRKECALRHGRASSADIRPTPMPEARDAMTRMAAYVAIKEGLSHAGHGCRQLGAGHRGEEWWVRQGWALRTLEDKAIEMIRLRAEGMGLVIGSC